MTLIVKLLCQSVVLFALISCLSACALFLPSQETQPSPTPSKPKLITDDLLASSEPLVDLSIGDIAYAQNALIKLGYKLGLADGIWGPRSAQAIRQFEASYNLTSAGGHLSELNLRGLEKVTKLPRDGKASQITLRGYPLSARVDAAQLREGAPQLVIIERARSLLAKPNPYSEVISELVRGTGIYVISLTEGWYAVELEGRIRGYLKAN
ncbi:MAG: peptidoglycan hydrolase-like protein with peptidoglycan-binding domain [Arenicella sp.]